MAKRKPQTPTQLPLLPVERDAATEPAAPVSDGSRASASGPSSAVPSAETQALIALENCVAAWQAGDVAESERWADEFARWVWGWDTLTFIWPADSPVGCPVGQWRRLDSGEIEATYTRKELAQAIALVKV